MSVTTTSNPVTGSVLQVLTDYDIHHSGSPAHPAAAPPVNETPAPNGSVSNPPHWDTEHRMVPAYRPLNRNLIHAERPMGSNPAEVIFIWTMLNGVGVNVVYREPPLPL